MKILATALARVIAYVEFVTTVDPHGQLLVEESIEALRKNYNFSIFPQKLADLNIMERAIVLAQGKFGDVVIERVEFHT